MRVNFNTVHSFKFFWNAYCALALFLLFTVNIYIYLTSTSPPTHCWATVSSCLLLSQMLPSRKVNRKHFVLTSHRINMVLIILGGGGIFRVNTLIHFSLNIFNYILYKIFRGISKVRCVMKTLTC